MLKITKGLKLDNTKSALGHPQILTVVQLMTSKRAIVEVKILAPDRQPYGYNEMFTFDQIRRLANGSVKFPVKKEG